jgi:hypothetical protein
VKDPESTLLEFRGDVLESTLEGVPDIATGVSDTEVRGSSEIISKVFCARHVHFRGIGEKFRENMDCKKNLFDNTKT